MSDPITELTQTIRSKLLSDTDFSSIFGDRLFLYSVPDNWVYPYVTAFTLDGESWMTLGDVSSGENFILPLYAFGKSPSDLRNGTSAINDVLHLNEFSTDNYQLIYARRISWSKPEEINQEEGVYVQAIRFDMRLEKL